MWFLNNRDFLNNTRISFRHDICRTNIGRILFALKQYHDDYGEFPKPVIESKDGLRHSWRAVILPYLEITDYRMTEPWDSPWNSKVQAKASDIFRCPHENQNGFSTSYFMITIDDTNTCTNEERKIMENSSVLIVEGYNTGINCLSPCDIPLSQVLKGSRQLGHRETMLMIGGVHKAPDGQEGCFFVGNKDGTIRFLPPTTTPEELFQYK